MKHNLKDIKLPKDSRNEQLEIISKNNFRPLFNVENFILKEELIDNGIDFRVELKESGNKLGFGFNFQLKSSESTSKNMDGSYSKSIETSNIEYLLNNGQSAFYGFFISEENSFYYEDLKDIITTLNRKNPNWQGQASHTIRFHKKLNGEAIKDIFEATKKNGLLLRKIQSEFAERNQHMNRNEKIIIDYEGNFTTDFEIKEFIEKYGWALNDECRWKEIIVLHNKTSVGSKKTALYSFFVGLSYTYTGEYFKALDCFKSTIQSIEELEHSIRGYALFFYAELRFLFGLINKNEYDSIIEELPNDSDIKYYIQLEEIEKLIPELYNSDSLTSKEYEDQISKFLQNDKINHKIKLLAKIGIAAYKGEQLICAVPYMFISSDENLLKSRFVSLNKEFRDLLLEAEKVKSPFISHYCSLKHNKFLIQFDAIWKTKIDSLFERKLHEDIQRSLYQSYSYFIEIGHIDNQIFSLTILLESYQSCDNKEKVNEVISKLGEYIERHENPDLKKRIDFMIDGGTFVQYIINQKEKIKKIETEINSKRDELQKLDKLEVGKKHPSKNSVIINLFPMGYFQIPKAKIENSFKILGIEDISFKEELMRFFDEGIIPVINVYVLKITQEGPLNGNLEYAGIDSYRKMHSVRKAFFENKFYKTKLTIGEI